MAKRLSNFFGLPSKHESTVDSNTQPPPTDFVLPTHGFLPPPSAAAQMSSTTKAVPLQAAPFKFDTAAAAMSPLTPPPIVTDTGVRRGSREGRPESRARSDSSYRGSSSSRPRTSSGAGYGTSDPSSADEFTTQKLQKRKSWIPGKGNKANKNGDGPKSNKAWIAGLREHVAYDLNPLLNADPVTELWEEEGDVIIHLFPASARKGPSFKLPSELFKDSRTLGYLHQQFIADANRKSQAPPPPPPNLKLPEIEKGIHRMSFMGTKYSRPRKPTDPPPVPNFSTPQPTVILAPRERVVHLPLEFEHNYTSPGSRPYGDDLELIVLYRNFFSFLAGGALIATPRQNSLYSIFMGISSILKRLQFGNEKGSSWGTVPWSSFCHYTEELRLTDVRASREKNIEAIVLGEAMKSWPLYNEGFAHAIGRLDDIKSINSPKFNKISAITLNRMERAALDLHVRLNTLQIKLNNFDFPSMFSGIANSQTATEARLVRFKAWKAAFVDFRQFVMALYKKRYGSWPPKASSKKNKFEESGLNRLLIREVYNDFTEMYDMLVDRSSITTRTNETTSALAEDASGEANETIQHAIRSVESEYDRSTPPVNPPIPFDVPLIPALVNSFHREHVLTKTADAPSSRKLASNETNALLLGSYNRESIKPSSFCQEFLAYERKLGQGKTVQDLVDNRCGQWLFMYAVIQSLPMLVVDARELSFIEGVEYFLCMAPRGGRPWMKEDTSTSRAWYNVASGGGLVSLPADMIDHSTEGIYRRSHCWQIANDWANALGPLSPVVTGPPQPEFAISSPSPSTPTDPMTPAPLKPHNSARFSFMPPPNSPDFSPHPSLNVVGTPLTDGPAAGSVRASTLSSSRPSSEARPVSSAVSANRNTLAIPGSSLGVPKRGANGRSSVAIGLEEVAAPTHVHNNHARKSSYNPNITFDNILGPVPPMPVNAGVVKKTKEKGGKK